MQVGQKSGKARFVLERINTVKFRFKDGNAFLVNGVFIDASGIVVADLLFVGAAVRRFGSILQNAAQHGAVALRQLSKAAPDGLIRRDGIIFLPVAASELVKVHTGVSSLVQGGDQM